MVSFNLICFEQDVEWTPYCMSDHPQKKFGTRVGPIICNNYVVHHQPHIAYNQFPVFDQYRLETLNWRPYKICFKHNSGDSPQNLLKHYEREFEWWNAKHLAQNLMEEKNIIVNSRSASRKRHNRSAPSPLPRPSSQPSAHNEDISVSGGSNILEEENLSPLHRPSPQPSAHDKESSEAEEEGELKKNEQPIMAWDFSVEIASASTANNGDADGEPSKQEQQELSPLSTPTSLISPREGLSVNPIRLGPLFEEGEGEERTLEEQIIDTQAKGKRKRGKGRKKRKKWANLNMLLRRQDLNV